MGITWRKDGVLVNTGIRDFGRRLVISLPAVSDSGYYECEASLRGANVASATAGAFLHVLGEPLVSTHDLKEGKYEVFRHLARVDPAPLK